MNSHVSLIGFSHTDLGQASFEAAIWGLPNLDAGLLECTDVPPFTRIATDEEAESFGITEAVRAKIAKFYTIDGGETLGGPYPQEHFIHSLSYDLLCGFEPPKHCVVDIQSSLDSIKLRDELMATQVADYAEIMGGGILVAVGALHIPGILQNLGKSVPVNPIFALPQSVSAVVQYQAELLDRYNGSHHSVDVRHQLGSSAYMGLAAVLLQKNPNMEIPIYESFGDEDAERIFDTLLGHHCNDEADILQLISNS